jgi:hypothetical protein
VVNRIFTPRRRVRASHTEEQNCLPLSEVTCAGTLNLATQPLTRARRSLSPKWTEVGWPRPSESTYPLRSEDGNSRPWTLEEGPAGRCEGG